MKKVVSTSIVLLLMLTIAPQISALEIEISENGTAYFYQDKVLGNNSDTNNNAQKQRQPIKSLPANNNQQIRIRPNQEKIEVQLTKPTKQDSNFKNSEKMDANRLEMKMPAQLNQDKIQNRQDQPNQNNQAKQEYQQQLQQQRQEREEERLEIRSKLENKEQRMELESRQVKARVLNGAEFTIDPETNQVNITTPSGQEHQLNHLPDQAVERLLEKGLIDSKQDADSLIINSNEQGDLLYQTQANRTKRVFGLIPWQRRTSVSLNDQTGEVNQTDLPPQSMLEQMLDLFSN